MPRARSASARRGSIESGVGTRAAGGGGGRRRRGGGACLAALDEGAIDQLGGVGPCPLPLPRHVAAILGGAVAACQRSWTCSRTDPESSGGSGGCERARASVPMN